RHPRGLPPFPTRRSSDLRQLDRGLGGLRSAGDQVEPRVVHGNTRGQGRRELLDRLRRELGAVNVGELTRLVADRIGDLAHAVAEDRKSTRLNSSHEWISY